MQTDLSRNVPITGKSMEGHGLTVAASSLGCTLDSPEQRQQCGHPDPTTAAYTCRFGMPMDSKISGASVEPRLRTSGLEDCFFQWMRET